MSVCLWLSINRSNIGPFRFQVTIGDNRIDADPVSVLHPAEFKPTHTVTKDELLTSLRFLNRKKITIKHQGSCVFHTVILYYVLRFCRNCHAVC